MAFKSLLPSSLAAPFGRYAHGVAVPAGQTLVRSSGQLAINPDGSIPESAEDQAKLIFDNLDAILDDGGLSRDHVCHIGAYVTAREHMADYMRARDVWLSGAPSLPASTLLIVSGFTRPEFLVEIEVTAVGPAS